MFFLRSSSSIHYRTHLRDVLSSTPPTTKLEMAKRHTCNSSKVSEMFKPWEPTTFIFWGYNPYFGGVKPSFFMVLGSKGSYYQKAHSAIRTQHVFFFFGIKSKCHILQLGRTVAGSRLSPVVFRSGTQKKTGRV